MKSEKKLLNNHRITPSPISAREGWRRNFFVAVDYCTSLTVSDSKGVIIIKRQASLRVIIITGCGTVRIARRSMRTQNNSEFSLFYLSPKQCQLCALYFIYKYFNYHLREFFRFSGINLLDTYILFQKGKFDNSSAIRHAK